MENLEAYDSVMVNHRVWTSDEITTLKRLYPSTNNKKTVNGVSSSHKSRRLNSKKSPEQKKRMLMA